MVQSWNRDVSSGVFVGGLSKGRALLGQCRAQDVGLGAFAGMQQGQLPNASVPDSRCWLRPHLRGHEHGKLIRLRLILCRTRHLGAGLSVSAFTLEEASLVQCGDRDMGSEVFVVALMKGTTQPGPGNHPKEPQEYLSGTKKGRTLPGSL